MEPIPGDQGMAGQPAAPTHRGQRLGMLDTTRGIAVLGILLLNIVGLGLPDAYEDPTNWGGHTGANLIVWRVMSVFFEGTMRGLFTLLFGAGALLFLGRHLARATPGVAKLYYRRTCWLIVFGLINAYVFLWEGDILFYYGLLGLLLFPFRKLSTRQFVLLGIVILAVPTAVKWNDRADYIAAGEMAAAAEAARASGTALSAWEQYAIDKFQWMNDTHKPAREEMEHAIARMTQDYASASRYVRIRTLRMEAYFFTDYAFAEFLGMMFIGMALLKLGILTGNAPTRIYRMLMLSGYGVGLTVNLWEMRHLEAAGFSVRAFVDTNVTYDLGRSAMTLGHIGLIGLWWQHELFVRAKRMLADVGQMALTNYLSQSLICMFLFTGAGLALFGQLQRYQLYFVVAMIWTLQLAWSSWWLRRFEFGPAEWLWRTLTYWQRQPMRAGSLSAAATTAEGT